MSEIVYMSDCQACNEHQTDLSTAMSWWKSVQREWAGLEVHNQIAIWQVLYNNTKLDERTQMIQGFKKTNIKEMRKD